MKLYTYQTVCKLLLKYKFCNIEMCIFQCFTSLIIIIYMHNLGEKRHEMWITAKRAEYKRELMVISPYHMVNHRCV